MSATKTTKTNGTNGKEATPVMHQRGHEIQRYGTVTAMPIGVSTEARQENCTMLNQLLADTITLFNLYKKAHWQVKGHTFYQLHLLYDKHAGEQLELVDMIAERIQMLGGVATGMPAAVAKLSKIENPPDGVEEVPVVISRLLEAHETIITFVNEAIETDRREQGLGHQRHADERCAAHQPDAGLVRWRTPRGHPDRSRLKFYNPTNAPKGRPAGRLFRYPALRDRPCAFA